MCTASEMQSRVSHIFITLFFVLLGCSIVPAHRDATVSLPNLLGQHKRVVVCYVASWAAYRPGNGAFSLNDLDPTMCTHLVYAFAGLNATTGEIRSLDPFRDLKEGYGHGWYEKLTNFKQKYPHLKVTLAVGGWNEGTKNFTTMSGDPILRKNFVSSVVATLTKHGFDGLDLDWEFPVTRGGVPEDKENFVLLVKDLRAALAPRGLILTSAFGAGPSTIDAAYDVARLGSLLDLMHIMCYDYHGAWDKSTLPNAPLTTKDSHDKLSVQKTMEHLKSLGAPMHKVVLGVPTYGRTFVLNSLSSQDVSPLGSSAENLGFQGPFTRENGFMGYNEICLELDAPNSEWKKAWDDVSKTPYAEKSSQKWWLSYDDEKSVSEKAKYAIQEGLAGVMIWSMDTDDFRGDCRHQAGVKQQYPLLTALNVGMVQALSEKDESGATTFIPTATPSNKDHIDSSSQATVVTAIASIITALLSFSFFSSIYFRN